MSVSVTYNGTEYVIPTRGDTEWHSELTSFLQDVAESSALASDVSSNVTDVTNPTYGATGDGVTDDSAAIIAAQLADTTGTVYLPAGTYALGGQGLPIKIASGGIIRGAGMYRTTLKSLATITNWLAQSSSAYPCQNITIEDMTFDTNSQGLGAFLVYGEHIQGLTIRRCRFLINGKYGINPSAMTGLTVEDCVFHGYATSGSSAINISDGSFNTKIRRNKFRYCHSHILVDTGSSVVEVEDSTDHITIEDNDFDMGWWAWPATSSNSGGTVTYSSTVLTDSAASFSGLTALDTKRVLVVRRTGTIGSATQNYITDSGATFTSALRGDIVRSGTRFAFVIGAKSATNLRIEDWLDTTTYLPTTPPADGASYTLYKVGHFKVSSFTGTTITTYDGFSDMSGATFTPGAGTLYELYTRPNYNIHIEYAAGNVRVSRNTVRRGWSDQVSVYCNRADVSENLITDGQDMGITINAAPAGTIGHSRIVNNTIRHQGACAIFCSAASTLIANNVIESTTWCNHVNLYTVGGIQLWGAADCLVANNVIDGESVTYARAGIALHTEGADTNTNIGVVGNKCKGHSVGDIVIYGTGNTGITLRDNTGATISYQASAVGVDIGQVKGPDLGIVGTPEGVLKAGLGSIFHSSTGAIYYKGTSTGNTGWVQFGDRLSVDNIGSSPNAAGASASGGTLTLQPADATYGGVLTAGTQSIAGQKIFNDCVFMGSSAGQGDIKFGRAYDTSGVTRLDIRENEATMCKSNAANGGTAFIVENNQAMSSGELAKFRENGTTHLVIGAGNTVLQLKNTGLNIITSDTSAATASSTVGAFTFAPTATLDANDLVFDVKAVDGGSTIFSIDKEGDVVHAGATTLTGGVTGAMAATGAVSGTTVTSTSSTYLIQPNGGNPSASTVYNGVHRTFVCSRTLSYASWAAASTSSDLLLFQVVNMQAVQAIYMNVSTKFSGGGTTACTLQLGSTLGATDLMVAFDAFTAATFRGNADAHMGSLMTIAGQTTGGWMPAGPSPASWGNIYGRCITTTANVNALTQGSVTIYVVYTTLG